MAADFDAGSIEGTLDLNTKPFVAGLRHAKAEAERFEKKKIEPTIGADTGEFDVKKARVNAEADALDKKKIAPEVELKGWVRTVAGLKAIESYMDKFKGNSAVLNRLSVVSGFVGRWSTIVGGVLALTAALMPATAALTLFGAAGITAFMGLIPPLALFGVSVASAFGKLQEANTAGKNLTGWAGKAQDALKGMTGAWKDLQEGVEPQQMRFLTRVFEGLAKLLPRLEPLLKTTTDGMTQVVNSIFRTLGSAKFEKFLVTLDRFMRGFTGGLAKVIPDLMRSFMNAFTVLEPIMSSIGGWIVDGADALRQWTKPGAGFTKWVEKTMGYLPALERLWTSFWRAVSNLFGALVPLIGPSLDFLTALFDALGRVNWDPFVSGITGVLHALTWLLQLDGGDEILMGLATALIAYRVAATTAGAFSTVSGLIAGMLEYRAAATGAAAATNATTSSLRGLKALRLPALAAGVGLLGASASSSSESFGLLGSAAGGALLGFSVGGPWGAAIGAGAGALFGLAMNSRKAREALFKSIPTADALAASLRGVAGAANDASRAQVLMGLGKKTRDAGKDAGISNRTMADAALGDTNAMLRVQATIDTKIAALKTSYEKARKAYTDLLATPVSERGADFGKRLDDARRVMQKTQTEGHKTEESLRGLADQLGLTAERSRTAREGLWAAQQGTQAYTRALKLVPPKVRNEIEQLGVAPAISQIKAWATQVGMSEKQVRAFARGMGLTEVQTRNLIKALDAMPSKKDIQYRTNADQATEGARRLQRIIDGLHGKQIEITTTYRNVLAGTHDYYGNRLPSTGGLFQQGFLRRASGGGVGLVQGPGSGISDSIATRVSNGEYVMRAAAVRRYGRAFFDTINSLGSPQGSKQRTYARPAPQAPTDATGGLGSSAEVLALLRLIAERAGLDTEALAEAMSRHSEAAQKRLIQTTRTI